MAKAEVKWFHPTKFSAACAFVGVDGQQWCLSACGSWKSRVPVGKALSEPPREMCFKCARALGIKWRPPAPVAVENVLRHFSRAELGLIEEMGPRTEPDEEVIVEDEAIETFDFTEAAIP